MSTQTQPVFGFKPVAVDALPRLACIGYVDKLGEGKVTEKGIYDMQTIFLAPTESGKQTRVNFLYQPRWLDPSFDYETMREEDGGDKMISVYRMHLNSKQDMSTLQGLSGSEEGFGKIQYSLIVAEDKSPEGIQAVFQSFFAEENPYIGYILKQRTSKTGEVDARGRAVKVLETGYEVGGYFFPTEENKVKLARQAENAKSNLVLTFEV
jgi:hypothetical protein